MEAVVLAGGFGTRLRSVIADVPKPMAPIGGRPFLEILLSVLTKKGFSRAILSLGYMADTVVSHFGRQFDGLSLEYEIEDAPLGTGGAIRASLGRCGGDHAFVFNGDTYLDLEVPEVETIWQRTRSPVLVARAVEDTARYGRLVVEGDRVVGFAEKDIGGAGLINAGCYVLPTYELDRFPVGQPFSFETDYLVPTVRERPLSVFVSNGQFIDIGVAEDYRRAQVELAGER